MGYSVNISIYAKTDRKNIVSHLAQYSVNAPRKFRQELKKYIGIINQTPLIFSRYDYNPDYRHVVIYGSYVMFYVVNETDKTVLIYRILHGAQDIEKILP